MKDLKIEDLKVGFYIKYKDSYEKLEVLTIFSTRIKVIGEDENSISFFIDKVELTSYELWDYVQDEKKKHNDHYKAQGIDTFTRMRANATKEEALGFIKYNIDKYNMRSKGQDKEDFEKMKVYCDEGLWWLNNKS